MGVKTQHFQYIFRIWVGLMSGDFRGIRKLSVLLVMNVLGHAGLGISKIFCSKKEIYS
jgi:hypothetical protein